jgi:exopolysaccharide biosynthesis polyprenyl glycosylphosphotransferase
MAVLDLELSDPAASSAQVSSSVAGEAVLRLSLLRQGVVGDAAVVGATVAAIVVSGIPTGPAWGLLGLVVAWRGFSFAAQPAYERARSFVPAVRLAQVLSAAAVTAVVAGVADEMDARRSVIVLLAAAGVSAASAGVHRVALRRTPTVLIGPETQVARLESQWSDRRDVEIVDSFRWTGALDLSPQRAGVVDDVLAAVTRSGATSVVIAGGSALSSPAVTQLVWALQRAQVECLVVADATRHAEAVRARRVADRSALVLRAPTDHLASALAKSTLDRVAAAVGLVALSPLLLVIAVAVRWDSHGPAVFTQVRTGRDGRTFRMYKFRSMVVDAESRLGDLLDRNEAAGPLFKIAHDPRITRLGRFLRRTSLDELLQLVNVVKGEMSLVGPRPALPSETESYDPWTWRRLHVKPGVTGLWQVSGRSNLTWEESVRKDLEYVNNQSLRLDLSILVRTVGAVLRRDGAH